MSQLKLVYVHNQGDYNTLTKLQEKGDIEIIDTDGAKLLLVNHAIGNRALVKVLRPELDVWKGTGAAVTDATIYFLEVKARQGAIHDAILQLLEKDRMMYELEFKPLTVHPEDAGNTTQAWYSLFKVYIANVHIARYYIDVFSRFGAQAITRRSLPITEDMLVNQ